MIEKLKMPPLVKKNPTKSKVQIKAKVKTKKPIKQKSTSNSKTQIKTKKPKLKKNIQKEIELKKEELKKLEKEEILRTVETTLTEDSKENFNYQKELELHIDKQLKRAQNHSLKERQPPRIKNYLRNLFRFKNKNN